MVPRQMNGVKRLKKAPASCAGARVVGSPEVDRVENDESTPITSCGRVSLRVSCTQGARETHVRVGRRPRRQLRNYRLGWLGTAPRVGQSFPTERLGISLTRRLPTPPDRPSHHYWPGALSFFKHPSSPVKITVSHSIDREGLVEANLS